MIYKINLDKKKEFEKWNYKQMLKHVLPLMIPILIFTDLITGLVFSSIPMPVLTICRIICFANIAGLILFFICSFLGVKIASSKLKTWELDIKENYAILKNSQATTTVSFSEFTKFKKDEESITFYLKGIRRFYINWNCFINSEELQKDLENITSRIGTFTQTESSIEQSKTNVKYNSKFRLFFYIILAIVLFVRICSIFLYRHM